MTQVPTAATEQPLPLGYSSAAILLAGPPAAQVGIAFALSMAFGGVAAAGNYARFLVSAADQIMPVLVLWLLAAWVVPIVVIYSVVTWFRSRRPVRVVRTALRIAFWFGALAGALPGLALTASERSGTFNWFYIGMPVLLIALPVILSFLVVKRIAVDRYFPSLI